MRRLLAVLTLCVLLAFAGCADAGIGLEPNGSTDETETPLGAPDSTSSPGGDGGGADGELSVHYINVGQADATLLISPEGETMLIDSGDWRDDGETVIEYLEARGVDRIDHLVSTHSHADHIGGHAAVIDHYETERNGVGAVYDSGVAHTSQTYENYLDAIERHDVTLYEVAEGDQIPFAGTATTVRNPEEPGGDDMHANGVVVDVRFGETTFLFTGDAEGPVENRLVDDYGEDLDVDVYQAGHHGSDTSSSASFLDAIDPEVAVISSGYESRYGHPHDEPLQRFAERDVRTTWTAVHGTTVVVSDGSELSVRTQHDVTTDPLEIRSAEEATADPSDDTAERFTVGGSNDRLAPPARSAVAAAGG